MEDHEDNGSEIDIEAQGSSAPLLKSDESGATSSLMRRSILFLRSTHKFIEAGERIASLSRVSSSSSSSTATFYTPLGSFDLKRGEEIQLGEIVVASSPDINARSLILGVMCGVLADEQNLTIQ